MYDIECASISGIDTNGNILVPGRLKDWFMKSLLCPMGEQSNEFHHNELSAPCIPIPPQYEDPRQWVFKEKNHHLLRKNKKTKKN